MIHLWKLLNPSDSGYDPSFYDDGDVPRRIANQRLDNIRRNANMDFFDQQEEDIQKAIADTKRTRKAATFVASDRLALHRTLSFVEKRWKEGASAEQAFAEAERVRAQEFDNIVADKALQERIENAFKAMSPDPARARSLLVDELPVRKGRAPGPGSRRRP